MKRTNKTTTRKTPRRRAPGLADSLRPWEEELEAQRSEERPSPEEDDFFPRKEEEAAVSGQDALGLYLQQMGGIPLLNRKQERELTQSLERLRRRYRRAALCNWHVIARVIELFEQLGKSSLQLERTVDA